MIQLLRTPSFAVLVIVAILLIVQQDSSYAQQDNRIEINGKQLFLNGGNIAWVNFANDVGPNSTDISEFEHIFNEVNNAGGNAMRFWVHISGHNTPVWDGNTVTGPGEGTIADLKAILDAAHKKDVGLVLCLWSFDMLRTSYDDTINDRNRDMLRDSALTQHYIDNALVPMLEELAGHPALIAWEVFNEPEGMSKEFGWESITGSESQRVSMRNIQRFTNQIAGAIHRTSSESKVSNGAWSFHSLANTSNNNSKNYYSDSELIDKGGDSLGTLDFYMVHYYDWGGTELSPFHNDKDSWGLNKPVVVGEFDVVNGDLFGVQGDRMYETLYDRGYAGALVWEHTHGGDFHESWLNGLDQMSYMRENYATDVVLGEIKPEITRFEITPDRIAKDDSALVEWNTVFSNQTSINGQSVASKDSMYVSPGQTTEYQMIAASDTLDGKDTAVVELKVVAPSELNRALFEDAYASGSESGYGNEDPNQVTDGDPNTRWSSPYEDGHWIYVDLGEIFEITSVKLDWEVAYGSAYDIQVSMDAKNWETVYSVENGDGGVDSLAIEDSAKARYVRMYGRDRGTEFGFSLWEFEVYGLDVDASAPDIEMNIPRDDLEMRVNSRVYFEANVTDKDGNLDYVTILKNGDSVEVLQNEPFAYRTGNLGGGDYTYSLLAVDDTGLRVESERIDVDVTSDLQSKRFEAENGVLKGNASRLERSISVSGGGSVKIADTGSVTFHNIGMGSEDEYDFTLKYFPIDDNGSHSLVINDSAQMVALQFAGGSWQSKDTLLTLTEEMESITFSYGEGAINLDYLEIGIPEDVPIDEEVTNLPDELRLYQNYPNPFNPATTIEYQLPNRNRVSLVVYSILGQEITTLVDKVQSAGNYSVRFDASRLSSGTYVYRLRVGEQIIEKKMNVIK